MKFPIALCKATVLFASSAAAVPAKVNLGYAEYEGVSLPNGLTQWLGIRYAAAPVGELRFQPPHDPPTFKATQKADKVGLPCLATNANASDTSTSEDCLFMNIAAPSSATSNSKLPVYFYIQGGGFNANSNANINTTGIIDAADRDIITVTINYRVGLYGFLTNGNLLKANNGLRDQRKALEWVQAHISKFGGDPNHVVLSGTSAGGASVIFHLTADNGRDRGLFHGAISQSGSFSPLLTIKESQYQYDQFATRMGCTGSPKETLKCLRGKTAKEIQEKNFNIPLPGASSPPLYQWNAVLDFDFVTDYTYRAFKRGKFIKVPTIFGDDTNGGTGFAPKNTTTLAESNQWMTNQYPKLTPAHLHEINELYPNYDELNLCPGTGCYWRQLSNTYQETRYMCPALYANSIYSHYKKSWAYVWNVEDPDQIEQGLGVPHTVESEAIIGSEYSEREPASYGKGGINEKAPAAIQGYWTSFVRTLDPNKHRANGTAFWKSWDNTHERLSFNTGGETEMEKIDRTMEKRCQYWVKHGLELLQ